MLSLTDLLKLQVRRLKAAQHSFKVLQRSKDFDSDAWKAYDEKINRTSETLNQRVSFLNLVKKAKTEAEYILAKQEEDINLHDRSIVLDHWDALFQKRWHPLCEVYIGSLEKNPTHVTTKDLAKDILQAVDKEFQDGFPLP